MIHFLIPSALVGAVGLTLGLQAREVPNAQVAAQPLPVLALTSWPVPTDLAGLAPRASSEEGTARIVRVVLPSPYAGR